MSLKNLISALKQAHLSMLVTSNCVVTDDPSAHQNATSWRHENDIECEVIALLIDALSNGTFHECDLCKNCLLKQMQERLQTPLTEHDKMCTTETL